MKKKKWFVYYDKIFWIMWKIFKRFNVEEHDYDKNILSEVQQFIHKLFKQFAWLGLKELSCLAEQLLTALKSENSGRWSTLCQNLSLRSF